MKKQPSQTKRVMQHALLQQFKVVRQHTVDICKPLKTEDYVVQPSPEVSPPKWHLGHTSWLFEEVILKRHLPGYQYYNQAYCTLFNSYYKLVGAHTTQSERGNLSRPTVAEVMAYREHVNAQMLSFMSADLPSPELASLIETAIHHEQQHQELLNMENKAIMASN
ncbi:unnamed protein product, partial [Chrysoparadoxa australica]